ncbi:replication initiation protein [Spiroplasma sp. AdecLV25b]|uniref:replication initiation protein n=1 Tax=Spiroplasma sp. AdecLV25b TaxID=3027162 RepID=UPI0027E11C33|nr:replication initiation protein [Spiroplasma sp. AdecLV25b]
MSAKKIQKNENQFIVKSNVITRAVRSSDAGIMTMRLFAFGLAKLSDKQYRIQKDIIEYNISIAEFVKYYDLFLNQIYEKSKFNKKYVTVIEREMEIISSFKIKNLYDNEPLDFDFTNLFLKCGHRKNTGKLYFKIYKEIFEKHFVNQIKNFTKFYLPYTKFITTKYTWPLYEYLRSYLYVSSKTSKSIAFGHQPMDFKIIAEFLNLDIDSSYFKNMKDLKKYVLEPVKKDLENTDVIMNYEIIKTGRKNTHIKFYTKLNMEKFAQQQAEVYGKTSNNYVDFQKNQSKQILNDMDKDSKIVWDSE